MVAGRPMDRLRLEFKRPLAMKPLTPGFTLVDAFSLPPVSAFRAAGGLSGGNPYYAQRRQEWRRGTQKCVHYALPRSHLCERLGISIVKFSHGQPTGL
jgi:hypothetical protein